MAVEQRLNYDLIEQTLNDLSAKISASHLHGMITGYLVGGCQVEAQAYLRSILVGKEKQGHEYLAADLFDLLECTIDQVNSHAYDFQLLIPDDEEPLRMRAKAFSEWCHAFLTAFDKMAAHAEDKLDDETKDALFHIEEFAELDYQSLDISEEDEKAFMEVTEYVRMAVLMVHTELHTQRDTSQGTSNKSLH